MLYCHASSANCVARHAENLLCFARMASEEGDIGSCFGSMYYINATLEGRVVAPPNAIRGWAT
jgi:hypothetical protein